jgi:transposase
MARYRSHSIEFKRQVAQEFLAGDTLHGLEKRHDISRNLIRVWVERYQAGAFDEDAAAADLLQQYEARIAALEAARRIEICRSSTAAPSPQHRRSIVT